MVISPGSPGPAPIPSPYWRHTMTLTEPTLAPPMAPSTVDMAQIFAEQILFQFLGVYQVAVMREADSVG